MKRSVTLSRAAATASIAATFAVAATASFAATTDQAVLERVASGGAVPVIIELDVEVQRERGLSRAQITSQRQQIANAQEQVRQALAAVGSPPEKSFSTTPAMALRADANALEVLQNSPRVTRIYEDPLSVVSLHESNAVIEADLMWAGAPPVTGDGYAVAVLDTGVDKNHTFFNDANGAAVVAEYCASTSYNDGTEDVITSLCPGEVAASSASGSGQNCDASIPGCDHGTHVAGIVAGRPTSISVGTVSGVAPDADLIAVQVFSKFNLDAWCGGAGSAPCVASYGSDQMLAMEHVLSLNESEGGALKVASVNMSLGGGQYFDFCDAESAAYVGVLNNLLDANIAVVIATGNNGWSDSINGPGCYSTAVSVASTTKTDRISWFSNIASGLVDVAAPGSSIASAVLSDNWAYKNGTSMATPHVAGAWALMREALDDGSATPVDVILDALKLTATNVPLREDGTNTGFGVARFNIAAASESVVPTFVVTPSATGNGSFSPDTAQNVAQNETATFTLTPDAGYALDSVGGTCPQGTVSGADYTTGAIFENCTVDFVFDVDTEIPEPPTITSVTAGDGRLTVAFTPNANGPAADSYTATCVATGSGDTLGDVMMAGVEDRSEWHGSAAFRSGGHRCGADEIQARHQLRGLTQPPASTADCSLYNTSISSEYDPLASGVYVIPVYWHVISTNSGTGNVTDANINAQMAVLNEDFAAIFDTTIQFEVVGITRTVNDEWFTDSPGDEADYKSALGVDPSRYLNIYTNDAEGYLGYATFPAQSAGSSVDGVVMNWAYVGGRNLPGAEPYDLGRTLVHEVGHYLGLWHTFQANGGDCANTYTSGDYIVDTWPHSTPDYGTVGASACGGTTAIENFMNYSEDAAMDQFTSQQSNRMVCSLKNYRPNLYTVSTVGISASGSGSPIVVTGLSNGTTYSCSVVANSAWGNASSASSALTDTPRAPTTPGVPQISRTESGDGELYLSVSGYNGGLPILEYAATCTDGNYNYSGSSTNSLVTVSGLTNGVSYQCNVRVRNSLGWSSDSSWTAPIVPEEQVQAMPVWLLYVATQTEPPSSGCNNTNDTDGDRLLDCYETNTGTYISSTDTGTDPNDADTDSDGISDGDEVLGTLDGLNLPAMGTNPLKKTILIEYDWLSDDTQSWYDISADVNTTAAHNHRPSSSVIADVEAVFAAAPVNNPDGSTGIQIIQDYGQGGAFTGGNEIADGDGNLAGYLGADFYDKKALNFASNRNGYFHYTILAHKYGGGATESSGYAEIQGDDLVVTSNWWLEYDFYVASTIVHELGHNLGLRHGGYEDRNNKPNYNSVMNYNHQFPGVDTDCTGCGADCSGGGAYLSGDGLIDYSSGTNSSLNENALTESFGICSNVATDWDRNGSIDGGTVSVNINPDYDSTLDTLTDFDDWTNIYYQGPLDADGAVIGSAIETVQCDNVPPNPF